MASGQLHLVLAIAWLLLAGSAWVNHADKMNPSTFQPLIEIWIFLVVSPLYFGLAYYSISTGDKSTLSLFTTTTVKASPVTNLKNAIFSTAFFPAAGGFLFLKMLGTPTDNSVLDGIENDGSTGAYLLEKRLTLLAISIVLEFALVNHGLEDVSKDLLRLAEGAVVFAVFCVILSKEEKEIFGELSAAFTGYMVLSICGLFYRRLVTDWKHPAPAAAAAAPAAEEAPKEPAPAAAKPTPAAANPKAKSKAKAKATPAKKGKRAAAKKAPTPAPAAPVTDDEDFDEEEATKMEEFVVPKALRYDSPGRKAKLSIFVEGKRRRKSPARFVAQN